MLAEPPAPSFVLDAERLISTEALAAGLEPCRGAVDDHIHTQAVEMKRDCPSHLAFGLFARRTGRDAPVEIRRVGRVTRVGLFDDDQVSHFFFHPTYLNILPSVAGA